jgi:penicillin-binding protein 2
MTVIFGLLVMSFWFLQIVEGESYVELAENNNQRTLALRAPRGILFDRDEKVLVESRRAYIVSIDRKSTSNLAETVRQLSEIVGLDPRQVQQTVDQRRKRDASYQSIRIIEDATLEQVARLRARQFEFPGVDIEELPARRYPTDALGAHLFGYVGEANESEVSGRIQRGSIIGKSGVELVYNDYLMGQDGERRVLVNSVGREVDRVGLQLPTEGHRVQLTIDADLQQAAEDGFRVAGFNGAALILDPRNGEVLTYVSRPSYDPNDFSSGIEPAKWSALRADKLRPLSNRVIQGRYSPGSTFKIVVATAALEEGVVTPEFTTTCTGGGYFYGRYYRCHLKGGHGVVNMRHALEKSCNVYFYTLGDKLGVDRIHKWAVKLGLAGKTGIDLPGEQESLVPSTEWKSRQRGDKKWYPGETISVAIGQGQVSVTPASLALMISTVANGGTRVTPHVVKAIDEGAGWKPVKPSVVADRVAFRPETLAALHDGLWMVVNAQGTGGRGRVEGRDVSGKTGTAQVVSNEGRERAKNRGEDVRDHGWFVFFAPRDNPEIAGVIFAEHGLHGYLGAPIARHVIETYFAKKEGKPFPSLKGPARPEPPVEDPDSPPVLLPATVAEALHTIPERMADVRTTTVLSR